MEKLKRVVITGGPLIEKRQLFDELIKQGYQCSTDDIAKEIYQEHKNKLGRHLLAGDRREYGLDVMNALIKEYTSHKNGLYFYNRAIPDGIGWERYFSLEPTHEIWQAIRAYRYDVVFILDPVEKFEDEADVVWADLRAGQRVQQLIIQGYVDANYKPIYVPTDFVSKRVNFILSNI
jgi:predicted ATPase